MSDYPHTTRSDSFRSLLFAALTFGIIIAVFYILSLGRNFFIPLVIAFLAVYLVDILSRLVARIRLAGHRIPKIVSVILSFAIIFGLGFVLAAIITNNAVHIAAVAPHYQVRLQQLEAAIFAKFGIEEPPQLPASLRNLDLLASVCSTSTSVAEL